MASYIVSRQRVTAHGEVLTGEREVSAMLDLVKHETERIESRFLEPACGNGNFLAQILERKLRIVETRYQRSQLEYERKAVLAVSSIYGIDILEDNVEACRSRLFGIFNEDYTNLFASSAKDECRNSVTYILGRNIIHGNALSLTTVGRVQQPIIFSEWSAPFNNSLLKRRDYTFSELLQDHEGKQQSLHFTEIYSDLGKRAFIPKELTSFPPIHFLKVHEHDE